jgi:RNA polymerase sigma factor (sigma-70 family)
MQELAASQLAARCQNKRPDGSHEPFCLELFRRAILEGCSLCWHYVYRQYYALVRYWVFRRSPPDPDEIDDLTQEAFTAFWRSYTSDKLARAQGLRDVLSYLKSCAGSAVAQAHRKTERAILEAEWDEWVVDSDASAHSAEAAAMQRMSAQELWEAVEACCNGEREHLLVHLMFREGLKPRHIAERFPDLFPTVSDVYRVERNLLERLRRHLARGGMCENGQNGRLIG